MNKGGKRFEIACYRNKVMNYRQGVETDLSEVLQTERVFVNVSKGEFAKAKDLERVFGTPDEERVIQLILEKGDLQVSDLERNQQYESMYREIATWISEHCVHPATQRPYTIPQIRQAMKQSEYAVHPTRSMKKQYLDCFKRIQQRNVLPIERAKMELQLSYEKQETKVVSKFLADRSIVPTKTTTSKGICASTVLVTPSLYRELEDLSKETEGGRLEILRQTVKREGDVDLEAELAAKQQQLDQQQQEQEQQQAQELDPSLSNQLSERLHINTTQAQSRQEPGGADRNEADNDNDDTFGASSSASHRKSQKKAQKKSKKAKRREKEEQVERQARIDAERRRQEDRAASMGTSGESNVTTSTGSTSVETGSAKSCNTCGGSFATPAEFRAHFRSDWHRYNIKLKMKGVAPVSEKEFLICDSDAFFDDSLMM